jgi:hypothetical protein
MGSQFFYINCIFVFLVINVFSQNNNRINDLVDESVSVIFYNVENLFDTRDDPSFNDEEFTPEGIKHWTSFRLNEKIKKIYKVIMASSRWSPPALIGLAEIENKAVLDDLIMKTPLSKYGFEYCHFESPDERGIDVALLFRPAKFELIECRKINVSFPDDPNDKTRDIIFSTGVLFDSVKLNVFVNHWPSRSGGVVASQAKRNHVAAILKEKVDSVLLNNCNANIIIMGDLNDNPSDESVKNYLVTDNRYNCRNKLVNIMTGFEKEDRGTLKYKEHWYLFDQFIVTKNLIQGKSGLKIKENSIRIIMEDFMLEDDTKYLGFKPFRTYNGPQYNNGYSDHFPVCLELINK